MFETYIYIHIFILDTLRVLYRNYCAPTPCPQNVDNQNAVLYCYYYLPFPTLFFFILIPLLTLTKVGHLENQVRKISRESEVPCCENSPEPSTLRPLLICRLLFSFFFFLFFFFFPGLINHACKSTFCLLLSVIVKRYESSSSSSSSSCSSSCFLSLVSCCCYIPLLLLLLLLEETWKIREHVHASTWRSIDWLCSTSEKWFCTDSHAPPLDTLSLSLSLSSCHGVQLGL